MKKIVLIDDDRAKFREEIGATFVDEEEYDDCLLHIEKLNKASDFSFIRNAACVMIHYTLEDFVDGKFHPDSHEAKKRIDMILQDLDIPNVTFSDGHAMEADWREDAPNVVYAIKKTEFYLNLKPFLDEYKKSGVIDLRIIAFGENYIVHMMSTWYTSIIEKMAGYEDDDIVSEVMIDRRSLRQFIENANLGNEVTFSYIMNKIEDGAYTVKEFKKRINNIINNIINYGKNIDTWE